MIKSSIKVRFTEDGQVESWQGMPILLDSTFEKVTLFKSDFVHCFLQDPDIVAALQPGKEELDKERLEVIGESVAKLLISRQVQKLIPKQVLQLPFTGRDNSR